MQLYITKLTICMKSDGRGRERENWDMDIEYKLLNSGVEDKNNGVGVILDQAMKEKVVDATCTRHNLVQ